MSRFPPLAALVVEDDEDACRNLQDILELDEHRVSLATSGAAGLAHSALPAADVILLDRKLPDGTAERFLPRLKAAAPQADVIVITGHADLESAIAALRDGATDYLLKPINPDALRRSLQRIAERRWLARERDRSEAAFRKLVEAAPCMIVILRPDGEIVYFSAFAEELTGCFAKDALGQDCFTLLFPEADREAGRAELRRIVAGTPTRGYRSRISCCDGPPRWIVWNAHRLDDFEGGPAALLVAQDVTEHEHAIERLVQAERLAAIGEAMTGLAHESRNALQRSQAGLEMLARHIADRPDALALVARIQKAQDDLHQLYEEVREYAAPLKVSPAPSDLMALVRQSWAELEHLRNGRSAALTQAVADDAPVCSVDPFAIRQVFRNILENSLAACADPVQVTASWRWTGRNGDRQLELSLRDNGPGLNDEQKRRIFDPFYTTKTRGTGLGMAICQRIVQAHGGRIAVGDGPGAEIVLTLPSPSAKALHVGSPH